MKKGTKVLTLLFVILSYVSVAQQNVAKVDVFGFIAPAHNVFRVSFERTLNDHWSGLLTFEKGRYDIVQRGSVNGTVLSSLRDSYYLKGWGVMGEARYYLFNGTKRAPFGLFTGVHYKFRSLTEYSEPGLVTDGVAHTFGLNTGYKLAISRITFDFLFGFGWAKGKYETPNQRGQIDDFSRNDLNDFGNSVRVEASVGYVFPEWSRKKKE
jgi:hypothetical protein